MSSAGNSDRKARATTQHHVSERSDDLRRPAGIGRGLAILRGFGNSGPDSQFVPFMAPGWGQTAPINRRDMVGSQFAAFISRAVRAAT
jgi:hypothetical protein